MAPRSGAALAMIATIPPRGHRADAIVRRLPPGGDADIEVEVGTAEFGNGSTTVHAQLAADALGTTPDRVRIRQSDTDVAGFDTGAYGSTGVVVAGRAVYEAAWRLAADPTLTEARGHSDGRVRSVAFNVHGAIVAVHPGTGEVRILHSVQAADAGTVLTRNSCAGRSRAGSPRRSARRSSKRCGSRAGCRDGCDPQLPRPEDLGHPADRGAVHSDDRSARSARREVDVGSAVQPGRPRDRERHPRRPRVRPRELPMSRDRVWRLAAAAGLDSGA